MLSIAITEFVLSVKKHVSKQCRENLGRRQDSEDKAQKFSAMKARSFDLLQSFARQRKNS